MNTVAFICGLWILFWVYEKVLAQVGLDEYLIIHLCTIVTGFVINKIFRLLDPRQFTKMILGYIASAVVVFLLLIALAIIAFSGF